MISGRQTLDSIETTLREQHQKINLADQQLANLGEQRLELQKDEVAVYRALARQRVDYIASAETLSVFDESEQKVVALLKQRKDEAVQLAEEIKQLEQQGDSLDQQRAEQSDKLEQAVAVLDDAELVTQQRLGADPIYQAQRDKTTEAERIALHADEKASRSEEEQQEKGCSYQNDPLFMYLWQRKFGTSEYSANPLSRWLDGRVATLIGYMDAHSNYARLKELPLRLREHSDRTRQNADSEYQALEQLDVEGRQRDGIPALETAEAQQQQQLDLIDAQVTDNESQYQAQIERKQRFAAGKDKSYKAVVDYLRSELSRDDLQQLRQEALSTPYPEDDVIVGQMLDLEEDRQSLEKTSGDIQQSLTQHQQRLRELESLRSEFKQRQFDNPRATFSNGALIGAVLQDVLNGGMKNDSLWDVLNQQQRHHRGRVNPDFGSGGFGRGSMWGGGRSRRGGGIFRGRPGGGRSGGFRTGGGF